VRVLRLLGRLGGVSKLVFEDIVNNDLAYRPSPAMNQTGSKMSNNKLLAWDPEKRLSFDIPFPDTKVEILLGNIFYFIYLFIFLVLSHNYNYYYNYYYLNIFRRILTTYTGTCGVCAGS
jgi:hypothetical protein